MPLAKPYQKVLVKPMEIINLKANTTNLERLHKAFPDIQLLLVVRNPVSRLVSQFVHNYALKKNKDIMPDLDQMLMNVDGYVEKQGLSGM